MSGTGTIIANRIIGTFDFYGISVMGNGSVNQVIVTDNYINCPATPTGIDVAEIANSIISNNYILAQDDGVYSGIPNGTYALENCSISGNTITATNGIDIDNCLNMRFDNNIIAASGDVITGIINGWWFIDGVMTTATANLTSVSDVVNTMEFKRAGLMVWNSTTGMPVWASGSGSTATWVDATGAVAHTPV